jgi:CRP-like cAMP-binding protein
MSQMFRQQIETIVSLTDEEFDYVMSYFTPRQLRKHQFLVQEGDLVQYNYFIVQGLTKSFYTDETGREHIVHFAMDNNWVTDAQAFHLQKKSSLNIYCLEKSEVLAISYDNIEKLCAGIEKMQYYFRKKSTEENILLQRRIQCLITNNAVNRYHDLASNYPALIQRVPKKMIASYLGVSRETLSRLLPQ